MGLHDLQTPSGEETGGGEIVAVILALGKGKVILPLAMPREFSFLGRASGSNEEEIESWKSRTTIT
jgi:hypothetical protein